MDFVTGLFYLLAIGAVGLGATYWWNCRQLEANNVPPSISTPVPKIQEILDKLKNMKEEDEEADIRIFFSSTKENSNVLHHEKCD